jgi:hypothetical protein
MVLRKREEDTTEDVDGRGNEREETESKSEISS